MCQVRTGRHSRLWEPPGYRKDPYWAAGNQPLLALQNGDSRRRVLLRCIVEPAPIQKPDSAIPRLQAFFSDSDETQGPTTEIEYGQDSIDEDAVPTPTPPKMEQLSWTASMTGMYAQSQKSRTTQQK
jgi:hypothetical protein